jgi:hypothetical protein
VLSPCRSQLLYYIVIVAQQDIPAFTELTYDYGWTQKRSEQQQSGEVSRYAYHGCISDLPTWNRYPTSWLAAAASAIRCIMLFATCVCGWCRKRPKQQQGAKVSREAACVMYNPALALWQFQYVPCTSGCIQALRWYRL